MKALFSILFFILASNSFAEDLRYYDVEIIVFENMSDEAKNSEHWPREVNLNIPANTVKLGELPPREWLPKDADLKESFKVLNADQYKLTAEVEKISASRSRRVIFHTAWRQPGLDKSVALPVYFKHEVPKLPISQNGHEITQTTDPSLDQPDIEKNLSILEGVVRISLARYLHLEAELSYRNKIPAVSTPNSSFSFFNDESDPVEIPKQGVIYFKQERSRMRSSELHYIDHPVLGILVQITPYLKPEAAEEMKVNAITKQ